jgi:hypothetical protein
MGHRKGQSPPQRTMFTPDKQPNRRRGKGIATTESLRYALRYDKSDMPLAYRDVKNICAILSNPCGNERNFLLNEIEKKIHVDYGGSYKNNIPK